MIRLENGVKVKLSVKPSVKDILIKEMLLFFSKTMQFKLDILLDSIPKYKPTL